MFNNLKILLKRIDAGTSVAFDELPTPPSLAGIARNIELVPIATLMKEEPDEEVVAKPAAPHKLQLFKRQSLLCTTSNRVGRW